MHTWYSANTGNHQGLVIDEVNGDNIAITYGGGEDAEKIATLNNLVEPLIRDLEFFIAVAKSETGELYKAHLHLAEIDLHLLKEIRGE